MSKDSALYTGLAVFGRVTCALSSATSVVLLVVVTALLARPRDLYDATAAMQVTAVAATAQVSSAVALVEGGDSANTTSNTVTVSFTPAGAAAPVTAAGVTVFTPAPLAAGDTVTLSYDSKAPANVAQATGVLDKHTRCELLLGAGALAAVNTGIAVLAFRSKPFAAVMGGLGAASFLVVPLAAPGAMRRAKQAGAAGQ